MGSARTTRRLVFFEAPASRRFFVPGRFVVVERSGPPRRMAARLIDTGPPTATARPWCGLPFTGVEEAAASSMAARG